MGPQVEPLSMPPKILKPTIEGGSSPVAISCAEIDSSDSDSDIDSEFCGSDTLDSINANLQEHFATEMQDIAQKRSHEKVAVLLVQWEMEGEGFMDTSDEVRSLREVFEETYNFTVYDKFLNTREPANHQLNHHLAEFVRHEDSKNALLIVYYAGHGSVGKRGGFYLRGGNQNQGKQKRMSRILWEEVEHQLTRSRADLLVIFDCCFAGYLAHNPRAALTNRIFEYIAATARTKTAQGPGDGSFTTALIWALRELSQEPEGFTANQLLTKINAAPGFIDTDQEPVCSTRGNSPSLYRLRLQPIQQKRALPQADDPFDPQQAMFLQLQFVFDKGPCKRHITAVANKLKELVRLDDVPLRQVRWKGLSDVDKKRTFQDVAYEKVLEARSRNKRLGSQVVSPISQDQSSRDESSREPQLLEQELVRHDEEAMIVGESVGSERSVSHSEMNRVNADAAMPGSIGMKGFTTRSVPRAYALATFGGCVLCLALFSRGVLL